MESSIILMAKSRIEIDEDLHRALSIQATRVGMSLKDYVGSLLLPVVDRGTWAFLGIDPSDKSVIGEPSATDEGQKSHFVPEMSERCGTSKPQPAADTIRVRRPPILDDEGRKQRLIEMVRAGASLSEIGEALGGYDRGGVKRAIDRLREAGELEGEAGEEATSGRSKKSIVM